jgi:hypothetical protein
MHAFSVLRWQLLSSGSFFLRVPYLAASCSISRCRAIQLLIPASSCTPSVCFAGRDEQLAALVETRKQAPADLQGPDISRMGDLHITPIFQNFCHLSTRENKKSCRQFCRTYVSNIGAGNLIIPHLLLSRLYCRYRNLTGSCLSARGLYRRSGISPCPEDLLFNYTSIIDRQFIGVNCEISAFSEALLFRHCQSIGCRKTTRNTGHIQSAHHPQQSASSESER